MPALTEHEAGRRISEFMRGAVRPLRPNGTRQPWCKAAAERKRTPSAGGVRLPLKSENQHQPDLSKRCDDLDPKNNTKDASEDAVADR